MAIGRECQGYSTKLFFMLLSIVVPDFARAHWPVVVKLDDEALAAELPQGAGGSFAVCTDAGAPFHIISKVVLRMNAWTGYLTAP